MTCQHSFGFLAFFTLGCSMDLRSDKADTATLDTQEDSGLLDTAEEDSAHNQPGTEPSDDSAEPSSEPSVELEPASEPDGPLHPHDQDDDGDGYTENQGDCNDNDSSAYPGAAYAESPTACRIDFDADGYGDSDPFGLVDPGGDCDDSNPNINPEALEITGDEIDSDCDNTEVCHADLDGDGIGGSGIVASWDLSCSGAGESTQDGDCDDTDPLAYPGSVHEVPYDGIDHNCDGLSDFDADGDGYDSIDWGGMDCDDSDPLSIPIDDDNDGFSICSGDCDDSNPNIHPDHLEVMMDGLDNDCDGVIDIVGSEAYASAVFGSVGDFLSYPSGLSLGDFNQDGHLDIAIGSIFSSNNAGIVHLLDGLDYLNWDSNVGHYSYAFIVPPTAPAFQGILPPIQGDINGDGLVDLTLAGSDLYGSESAISIFYNAQSLSGMVSSSTADVQITGANSYPGAVRIAANVDFDGNGEDELFFADLREGSYSVQNDFFYDENHSSISHVTAISGGVYDLSDARDTHLHRDGTREFLGESMTGYDVDGDGYEDLFFTAPGYDGLADDAGCLFFFKGSGLFTALESIEIDHSFFGFGDFAALCSTVAGDFLGWGSPPVFADFDGDSLVDMALAAPGRDSVFIFYDISDLNGILDPDVEADVVIQANSAPDWFGYSLAAGDFDMDGIVDLAVGAPGGSNPIETAHPSETFFNLNGFSGIAYPSSAGKVYLFTGATLQSSQSELDAASVIEGVGLDLFGMTMTAGDISGDGFPELMVGSPRFAGNQGRLSIYSGAP